MRTTLTLDDDLAAALKERARVSGRSFKEVVNEALRRGLSVGAEPPETEERFRVVARARGFRPGIDPRRLNQLLDELEVGERLPGLSGGPAREPDRSSRVHEEDDGEDAP